MPLTDLVRIGESPRYSGAEKLAAMKAYATAYDAAHHGKLSPERAEAFRRTVLPALLDGKVGIRIRDGDGARAQYNGRSADNSKRFEPNTLYFPSELELGRPEVRGVIIHELEHVVQDAERREQTFLEAEREGHTAFADYLLRESGAIVPTARGTAVDERRVQALIEKTPGLEAADKRAIAELVEGIVAKNRAEGREALNGGLADDPAALEIVRDLTGEPRRSFEEEYVAKRAHDPSNLGGKTEEQLRRDYQQRAPNDGL